MSDKRAMSSRTRNFVDHTCGSLMFRRIVYLQFVVQFNATCLLYRIFEGVVLIIVVIVINRNWRRCFCGLLRHAYELPLFTSAATATVTPLAASGLYTTAARARRRLLYRTPNVCRRHVNVASVSVTPREQFYHISAREVLVS